MNFCTDLNRKRLQIFIGRMFREQHCQNIKMQFVTIIFIFEQSNMNIKKVML